MKKTNLFFAILISFSFTSSLRAQTWISLASNDPQDAMAGAGTQDGKDFYYYNTTDSLWFKVVCYSNGFSPTNLDVIVMLDLDNNQSNGTTTWGYQNTTFKYDKYIVALTNGTSPNNYTGSIGIVNSGGGWASQNSVTVMSDAAANSYMLGVKKSDLGTIGTTIKAIIMVGHNHGWNDDIPDTGSGSVTTSTISGISEQTTNNNYTVTNIFPNPSTGKFNIQIDGQPQSAMEVQVNDLLGKQVYSEKLSTSTTELDLSNQPKGIYFVKIYDQNSAITIKKIVIQ